MFATFSTRALCAFALVVGLSACDGDDTETDTDDPEPGVWLTELSQQPGAVLSIWGSTSDDVWLALSAGELGTGPTAMNWDGSDWNTLTPPITDNLWWVTGPDADHIWFCGENGNVLRYDRTGQAFTQITSPTTATLFGIWGADGGPTYAVGGFVDSDDPPVILRIEGDTATDIASELPNGLDPAESFFKVWGSSASNVWVIGDRGTVLNYDGSVWSRQTLPSSPRLVTVNGNSSGDMIVVGGNATGIIFERTVSGGVWDDVSPTGASPLNGIFLGDDGQAVVAGFNSRVMERIDGVWITLPAPSILSDWHATWIDENDEIWVVGGNLMGLSDGTVLRFDPDALPPYDD